MEIQFHRLRTFNVLVVDDDMVHQIALDMIFRSFAARYQLFKFINPVEALAVLTNHNTMVDILLCGIPLSDPDTFNLVHVAAFDFNITVIAMISNYTNDAALQAILIGASRCVAKPVTDPQIFDQIWQDVVRDRRNEITISFLDLMIEKSSKNEQESIGAAAGGGAGSSRSNNPMRVQIEEGGGIIISDQDGSKKPRFVWSEEYQKLFLEAYESIKPPEKVTPAKVLTYMKSKIAIPNLTRENVASHLQNHRKLLQKSKDTDVIIHQFSTSERN